MPREPLLKADFLAKALAELVEAFLDLGAHRPMAVTAVAVLVDGRRLVAADAHRPVGFRPAVGLWPAMVVLESVHRYLQRRGSKRDANLASVTVSDAMAVTSALGQPGSSLLGVSFVTHAATKPVAHALCVCGHAREPGRLFHDLGSGTMVGTERFAVSVACAWSSR